MDSTLLGLYRRLPGRLRRRFWLLFGAISCTAFVETAAMACIALFASSLTDPAAILASSKLDLLRRHTGLDFEITPDRLILVLAAASAGLLIVKNSLTSIVSYCNGRYSARVDSHFGDLLLAGFLHVRYEWLLARNSADLVTALEWRKVIGSTMAYMGIQALADLTLALALTAALLAAAPMESMIAVLVVGVLAVLLYGVIRPALDRSAKRASEMDRAVNRQVTKALHGVKDVKVCGRQEPFMRDYRVYVDAYALTLAKQRFLARVPTWALEAAGFSMLCGLVIVMMTVFHHSAARVTGTVALLGVAAWRLLPAFNRIINSVSSIRQMRPQARRILDYLDDCEKNADPTRNAAEPLPFDRDIRLEAVDFRYQKAERAALEGLDLRIGKGASVGVVGPSGAGKSTLVDLFIGLLRPTSGRVLVDGLELTPERLRSWLDRIGYVGQTPYIYDGTLAENVAFGLTAAEIDRARVMDCCVRANVDDFLADLPGGLDALIGERGTRLSGGQRQRVAIARALYRNPEVLIFDEATSALDTRSEEAITRTIRQLTGRMTLIIIAHRLSTVEGCDLILHLEGGRLKRAGTPTEVLPLYVAEMRDAGESAPPPGTDP